jgi:hypothetical protein
MKNPHVLIAILLSCLGLECFAQESSGPRREWRDIISIDFSGDDCTPKVNAQDKTPRICKGVEGYSLLVKGEQFKPELVLIAPDGKRHPIEYWDPKDPGFRGMPPFVTWVVVNRPNKTIALKFFLHTEPKNDFSMFGSYDVVARVSPGPVCIVGSVAGGSLAAMESMGIASSPSERPCLAFNEREKRNWFNTARRLASEDKIQEAQAAFERVEDRYERFIVYREIGKAQAKAGDLAGARRTLMAGRAEALKNNSGHDLAHTLGQIVLGMTEAGFYDAAKADLKLFDESDRPAIHLSIPWYQSERGDLEAAKATYREIIQLELDRTPRPKLDWILREIAESQVRAGLIEDARHTASLIRDPNAKKFAEDYIPKQPIRPE